MSDQTFSIPAGYWKTLRAARIHQLRKAGVPEDPAGEFADIECEMRRQLTKLLTPEDAILADLTWYPFGGKYVWLLETEVPPVPSDMSDLGI